MRLKLTLAYDGTGFRGWARQPGERTVEGELAAALGERLRRRSSELAVAGRTDTGVHALANVVSVDVDGRAAAGACRRGAERRAAGRRRGRRRPRRRPTASTPASARVALLPLPHLAPARALAVRGAPLALAPARRSTSSAERRGARRCVGEHDFRAFTPTETQHHVFVRIVESARWHDRGDSVSSFEITADSFLRHMVRTLVGTMLEREPRARAAPRGRPRSKPARPPRRAASTCDGRTGLTSTRVRS